MADKQVIKPEEQAVANRTAPETDIIYFPEVDIRENGECIRLVANMPGVDQASANVTVENNVLTIEGQAHAAKPEGYELVGQEYALGKFRRDFTLSDAVDTGNIKARVRNGTLEVVLSKQAELKARTVKVET